jgi:hypothetical protein
MNRSLIPTVVAFLATCHAVQADGFGWPARPVMNRLPITRLIGLVQEKQPIPEAPPPPPIQSNGGTVNHGYPFSSSCCDNSNDCCQGIWSGYSRSCGCGHRLFPFHLGRSCSISDCGGGGCCANTFSGGTCGGGCGWGSGCGWGCGLFSLHAGCCHGGLFGHLFHRHHGICDIGCGCDSGGGCTDCIGQATTVNGVNSTPRGAPTPAPDKAPPAPGIDRAAFRPFPILGLGAFRGNW